MSYYFAKTIVSEFDTAISHVKEELQKEGFGIITEIDLKTTFKNKLDADFRPYTILGACSPKHAFKAIAAEDKIGTMLPCNVVVQEVSAGKVEVAAINPVASMQAVENNAMKDVANDIREKLKRVIDNL